MDHLPTEVLQQIVFEIGNNLNAPSPQADLASFARVTKRISSIATPVLYRSIRLTDGRSAQLLVRTYLDGINPFTLVKSAQFTRAELQELNLNYSKPLIMKSTYAMPVFPPGATRRRRHRRVTQKCEDLPRLDVLASYGFLSNLTSLLLSNFTDDLHLVPLLLGPGRPLRQQLRKLGIVNTEDDHGSLRDVFAVFFVLGTLAFVDPDDYLIDCPVITAAEVFAVDEYEDYSSPWDRLSTLHAVPPSPSVCREALYDFDTFASVYDWPLRGIELLVLSRTKMMSPPGDVCFARLVQLRIHLYWQEYLPLVLNKAALPHLKSLALVTAQFCLNSIEEMLFLRRTITRPRELDCGRIIGPREHGVVGLNNEAVFGVANISSDWLPLAPEQLANFPDYQGQELDLLDLSGINLER